jgi:CheY-like chemotaxis protein
MKAQPGLVVPPPAPTPVIVQAPTPLSVSDSKGARSVLVVDDDEAIRRLIVRALRTEYTVYEARDGEEAAQLLEVHPRVDCVVLDIMMPRLSGTDLARKMRSDDALKHVPVVFVTAKKAASEMAEGISLGARFYLSKPFSLKTLLAKVGEAMAKR